DLDLTGDLGVDATIGLRRAEELYDRVFLEYGDDSVAQLGGVHLACEDVSNILTKVLERGRLMAYLEQSTRYIPYTSRRGDRWRYFVPPELDGHPLRSRYAATLDAAFETYARWFETMRAWFERKYPKAPEDSDGVYRAVIRAKALDTLRGLLPAATQSNVGIYGTGQAYEALLLRMRAHPLAEARQTADLMLDELRKVIPAFLTRVDQPDRGGRWTEYFEAARAETQRLAQRLDSTAPVPPRPEVTLTDFDPDGEVKVVAAALYASSSRPDDELLAAVQRMGAAEREQILRAYVGDRANRRHKPGRAFERTSYRFDVLADYGAFRDLQRHRLLTVDWQALTPRHGFVEPEAVIEAGADDEWQAAMERSAGLYDALEAEGLGTVAQYAVSMAYRVRFVMDMNAREAMHVIELRTAPAGHPAYRRVCQQMHALIADRAGHRAIAASMRFADHSTVELERLQEERRLEAKRRARA
ncbi:MAG TPA: FAD-dependent thymidylate synthase, partial [Vicinamibacterales bacterium]|nr:FAD-dependent thymidylate synthase [Vicinamibacterales bacterium]